MSDAHDHRPEQTSAVRDPMVGIPGQIVEQKNTHPSDHTAAKLEETKVLKDEDHQTQRQDMPDENTQAQEHSGEKDIRDCFRVVPSNSTLEERMRDALSREKAYIDRQQRAINTASLYPHDDGCQQCLNHTVLTVILDCFTE